MTISSRVRGFAVLLTVLALPLLLATAAGARPAKAPKPTVVLVHGAWADSSSWDGSSGACSGRAMSSMSRRTRCADWRQTPRAWRTILSWYFVGTADHVLPPAERERGLAAGAPGRDSGPSDLVDGPSAAGRPETAVS